MDGLVLREGEVAGEIAPHTRWGDERVDLSQPSLPALKANWVLKHIPMREQPLRVLDYGCGEGKLLRALSEHFPRNEMFGTDIRTPADTSGYRFIPLQHVSADIWWEQFDVVTCIDVLEHVPDLRDTLSRIRRLLKRDGIVLLFIPVEGQPLSPYSFYRMLLGSDLYLKTKDHRQSYRRKALVNTIATFFLIRSVTYSYHLLGSLMDATFFALHKIPAVSRWWWNSNPYYRPKVERSLASRLVEIANAVCYYESYVLSKYSFGASGVHIYAVKHSIADSRV
jgi:2-polyprenyl-3-methyl-5-hydroxy-6-metoxy-1,4-benzoquinol methylase